MQPPVIFGASVERQKHKQSCTQYRICLLYTSNPVFGVILSSVFLHEQNQAEGWKIVTALLLVCAGIFLLNYQKAEKLEVKASAN